MNSEIKNFRVLTLWSEGEGNKIKRRMHEPIADVGRWLRTVVVGHQNYFAVLANMDAVHAFRDEVGRAWKHALCRRSQKGKRLNWARFDAQYSR